MKLIDQTVEAVAVWLETGPDGPAYPGVAKELRAAHAAHQVIGDESLDDMLLYEQDCWEAE